MDKICSHCHALKFRKEPLGMCCSNSKINLPPEWLLTYVSGTTTFSKLFLQNILKYNSSFQMASFGATNIVSNADFMVTFKVQGQIYHQVGLLLPLSDNDSKFFHGRRKE
ncbi:ATP-dependent DNA helicase [Caerostris darwini]|uniref:ATP-dependent DNA helicase n=1 Tax=Caerostris darwini TaxID=1538125 RepID=A0AAV4U7Y3_9ARAC|nr:ATP-dependent DNA helicase [Caerostris darwini]